MLLKLKKVSIFYDKVEAVSKISLIVGNAEFVAIIGANGAGKTSTLKAISGQLYCQGEIFFKGERIDNLLPHKIASKGIIHVPEGGQLFPLMSVINNLSMGAYLQKDKRKVAMSLEQVFDLFPILKTRSKQRADSLSGGERQMLAVGRALMADPQLLLMDEPTFGLSPILSEVLKEKLKEINQRAGTPILLVEQNAPMSLSLSNRAYVFEKGEIVLQGKSMDLITQEKVRKAYLGV
jgi:branched-chain amino acid transport system ATP-binding protein